MGWSSLLVPALVLALILYVPGILVNALLFRSRVLTIAFAPLTGAAVLGAASLVSGFKPGVWGLGLVVAVSLATMLLVAGLSFLGGRRPYDWVASMTRLSIWLSFVGFSTLAMRLPFTVRRLMARSVLISIPRSGMAGSP